VSAVRRTTAGRPVPVTLAPVSAADSGRPDSMDTRPRWRKRRRTAHTAAASGSAATWTPPRGQHRPSGRHRQVAAVPEAPPDTLAVSAAAACLAADTLVWTTGGWRFGCRRGPPAAACAHGRRRMGVHGRSATGGRHVPRPAQGCGPLGGGQRPSGQHPAALPAAPRTRPRCPAPRTPAGVPASSAQPADIDGPDAWTADAACGQRQPAHARRCGHPRRRQGRVDTAARPRWDSRQQDRLPPPNVRPERDRKVRHQPAPPWPHRQIRSLVLCVDLVGSRRIWPAHVGGVVDPDGSRRIPSDRLDDQPDDQAAGPHSIAASPTVASAAEWPHPYHGSAAHRRAIARLRSSHQTVGAAVMGSVADLEAVAAPAAGMSSASCGCDRIRRPTPAGPP
jgi:hypothetical protein